MTLCALCVKSAPLEDRKPAASFFDAFLQCVMVGTAGTSLCRRLSLARGNIRTIEADILNGLVHGARAGSCKTAAMLHELRTKPCFPSS